MNAEQAYINGFVKRAAEYGVSINDAIHILKYANDPNYHDGPGGSVFAPRRPLGQSDKSLAVAGTQTYAGPGGSVFAPRQPIGPSNESLAAAGTQNLQGPGSSVLGAIINASPQQPNLTNTATSSVLQRPTPTQITQPTTATLTPKTETTNRGRTLRGGSVSFPASLP